MRRFLLFLSAALVLMLTACSSGSSHSTPAAISNPAPNPHPGAPVGPLPAGCGAHPENCGSGAQASTTTVPKATTTTKPRPTAAFLFLKNATMKNYCNKQYAFCVTFPVDLTGNGKGNTDFPDKASTNNGTSMITFYSTLLVDHRTGRICPVSYPVPVNCQGFDSEGYIVSVGYRPGWTEQQAMSEDRFRLTPDVFDHVRVGQFKGNPSIFSTFHTKTGGYGPYIDVWHNGRMYSIWANGLNGAATYADLFDNSFRFTS